jgi:hypothetical protein
MKTWKIARRLLYQNRWLYLLLVLWPFGIAGILAGTGSAPDREDILSLLRQECLYGLALVGFTGSIQLGNEQRSRRIVGVLSRAVSRRQYLLALFYAAWIPLLLYTASFVLAGTVFVARNGQYPACLLPMAWAMLLLGLWTTAVGLFFASWLPSFLASTATLALLAAGAALPGASSWGPGHMLGALLGIGQATEPAPAHSGLWPIRLWPILDWLIVVALSAVFFGAATAIFDRKDLELKGD